MNNDLMIEALEALVEKKENENEYLAEVNNYYFQLWTTLIDYIGENGGKKAIGEATATLGDDYKKKLQEYIGDNFDA